jgi:subtilisin family serine protease
MGMGLWRAARVVTLLAVVAAFAAGGASSAPTDDMTPQGDGATLASLERSGGAVMLELSGEPSAVAYANARELGATEAAAGQAGKARMRANEAAQSEVLANIQSAGIDATVLYQVQSAYNGIAVQAEPGAVSDLMDVPGVSAVHVIPLIELHNHSSVPLIGSQQAWGTFGKTGTGMSIAVIDTGVDYVHTGFGGSGSSADYVVAQSAAANPPAATDNPAGFSIPGIYPSAKVVGGFDFAGDAYNASGTGAALIPKPDPNPMDCNGHGTHVAGTAAGTGVAADGTTYPGPYNATANLSGLGIGPGVAPAAEIYALRVFGCAGSTNLTAAALNWATDPNRDGDPSDHVDVINMSLGTSYGTPDDPSAAASNNAADLGVLVVTSAGNSGDSYFVSSSPGSAVRALSTASSLDAAERADAIIVNTPAAIAGKYIGSKSQSFSWTGANQERTGNVYYPATNQFGCPTVPVPTTPAHTGWSAADLANIAGRIVLVNWKIGNDPFPCGSAARANNAAVAGAAGIIMADSTTFLDTAIAGNASVPGMYTNVVVGDTLKSQLTAGVANDAVNVTLSGIQIGESIDTARVDALSSFSSRGPTARSTGLKPDIAAPGQTIWSPDRLTGFRGRSLNGTSMAAPHMAGVMALLKQTHPTWTVEELKALAMNTAGSDIFGSFGQTGDKYGPGRVGSGRVQVPAALSSNAIAYNADGSGSVSVSFGAIEVGPKYLDKAFIRIANKGAEDMTFGVSYDPRTTIPGVTIAPGMESITVKAGTSRTLLVEIEAIGALLQNTRDATVLAVQNGNARHWLSEASGLVILTPTSGPALRVPVYAAVRPASNMRASSTQVRIARDGTAQSIKLVGAHVNTGAEPLGYVSKVSAFEHGLTSGMATLGTGVSELARGADIQHIGAVVKGTTAYFGLSTYGDWAAPATDTQFNIQVDRNNDGTADVTAFTTRFTFGPNADPLDVFVTGVGSAAVSFTNIFNSNVNTAPYNNNVLNVAVPLASLALPAGTTSIKYRVVGNSRFWGVIDTTPWATYNVASPGVQFSDGLAGTTMYPDLHGQVIGVTYNDASFTANGSGGVLLLHHFNTKGKRAEVLTINK